MTTRRQLLVAGILFPYLAIAQGKPRRIGFLAPLSRSTPAQPDVYYDAFVAGMRELGYVEGKNLTIDWRFADGKFDQLPALAAELAALKPEVIVTHSTPAIRALQRVTSAIPVVFAIAIDPIASGFAASFAHPGGNITGLSVIDTDPGPKRLELLKTMVPRLTRVAVLSNPGIPAHAASVKTLRATAPQHGIKEILALDARTPAEIESAFAAMTREHVDGALIADDAVFRGQRRQIAALALKARLPVITPWREYVAAGGLLSFGQDITESFRRAATYVDKIFKGANPAGLPIEQPTRVHLAIGRKAAAALGISIPRDLLLRADEVMD
jgi:putative ABC transport system substrate-binding protein